MKRLPLILMLCSSIAFADDEAKIACDLAHAQAEVSAAELAAPSAFVSAGNQIAQKTLMVGLSQSVSGIVRANKLRSAADAQCSSIQSGVRLEQYTLWSMTDIQKKGAVATLKNLNTAIDLENSNVHLLGEQFKQKIVTIADVDSAQVTLQALEKQKATLLATVSTVTPTIELDDVLGLASQYQSDQANAAKLTAKSQAHGGWDFVVSAGENKPLGSQPTGVSASSSPFVTATIKYSFGTHAAMRAADEIGRNTQLLLQTQQNGYAQNLSRRRTEIQALIDIESTNVQNANRELNTLHTIRAPLDAVDSLLAGNARRTLDIQIKTSEADLAGATTRLAEYKNLSTYLLK